jgi:hypothetical protein
MHCRSRRMDGIGLALVLAVAACEGAGPSKSSDVSSGDVSGAAGASTACGEFATRWCARIEACAPGWIGMAFGNHRSYGDLATCRARVALACGGWVALSAGALNDTLVRGCAASTESATCADVIDVHLYHSAPRCIAGFGAGAVGSACVASFQCAAGYCSGVGDAGALGTCKEAAGGITYRSEHDVGGTCETSDQCFAPLSCESGSCVAPVVLGESCATRTCDASGYCDRSGAAPICHAWTVGKDGDACDTYGRSASGSAGRVCGPGLDCTNPNDMGNGHCAPYAAEGAACDGWAGPPCLYPAICFADRCTLPEDVTATTP